MVDFQRAKCMNATEFLSDEVTAAPTESAYALNIVGVYQDPVTQSWGVSICRPATQLTGEDHVRNTWYDMHSLDNIETLLEAVRAALAADVIVISVYAGEELPLGLYVWIDAWLPRRTLRDGALIALIGADEPQDLPSDCTRGYLQAVARKAHLDFIPLFENRLHQASPTSGM
jgi:hypothetical protein